MHNLLVGITNSGKSNLAKRFAKDSPHEVIVFDPMCSTGWPDNIIKFSDPKKFFDYINQVKSALIFCDEARVFWEKGFQSEADALLTRSRHDGQLIFLIAQRAKMIPPNARAMCSRVYAFRQNVDDSIALAQEYHPLLRKCTELGKGEFIASDGYHAEHLKLNYNELPPKPEKI